jgi:hypothetical protein
MAGVKKDDVREHRIDMEVVAVDSPEKALKGADVVALTTDSLVPVIKAGARAKPSAQAWMIRAACVWFVLVVWADVAVIATGRWRLLDALGALLIVGVLGQAILASVGYLAPMLTPGGPSARAAVRDRLETLPRFRTGLLNVGVTAVAAAAVAGRGAAELGAVLSRTGWALVTAVVLIQLALIASAVLHPGAFGGHFKVASKSGHGMHMRLRAPSDDKET